MMLPAPSTRSAPAVEWDDSPCPLCGSADADLVLEAQDPTPSTGAGRVFAVVRCRGCGLHFTNPRPGPTSLAAFYPDDYKPHRRPGKMRLARSASWWAAASGRGCPERKGGLPWHGAGRLLDFGCGGGSFLERMAARGWKVTGLDAAVGAVRRVREELGLTALVGTLPHPDLAPGSFDVVTMWHSLEHVHDPLGILREAYQLLTPGGRLIVACPNIGGWPFRWFGPAWFGLDLPRHLTHFTPGTLAAMLTAAGFAVGGVRSIRHTDWLRHSAKLAVHAGGTAAWQHALTWKPVAKLAAVGMYLLGGSDCMLAVAERPA